MKKFLTEILFLQLVIVMILAGSISPAEAVIAKGYARGS